MPTKSRRDPTKDLRALMEREEIHVNNPRRRKLQLIALLGPLALTLTLLALLAVFQGPEIVGTIVATMVFIFTIAGKFAIFLGVGQDVPFGPYEIATLVAYMDICVAVVLVYNLPRLYRLPGLGPRLEDLAEQGHYMLEQRPWLGRVTALGVVAFVMFPLTGTGAIGGSVFGRLLGLGAKRTMGSIVAGALLGSFGMAYFARTMASIFTEDVRDSWQFQAAGLGVLLAVIALVAWRGRKISIELRERRAARAAEMAVEPPTDEQDAPPST